MSLSTWLWREYKQRQYQPLYTDIRRSFIITKWNQTLFAMIGFTVVNMIGTIVLIVVPPSNSTRVGLFIAFNLMQAFAAVNPAIFLMLSRNSAGSTKKSFTYALTCKPDSFNRQFNLFVDAEAVQSWAGPLVMRLRHSFSGPTGHPDISIHSTSTLRYTAASL